MAGNKHTARNCTASIAKADSIVGVGLAPTLQLAPTLWPAPTLSEGPDFVRLNCMLVCSYTCTSQSLDLSYHSFSRRAIHVNSLPWSFLVVWSGSWLRHEPAHTTGKLLLLVSCHDADTLKN